MNQCRARAEGTPEAIETSQLTQLSNADNRTIDPISTGLSASAGLDYLARSTGVAKWAGRAPSQQ